jgi:hypothetical protein
LGASGDSPEEPTTAAGVWCRACGATTFSTLRTNRCVEGDLRTHKCGKCGRLFGSFATLLEKPFVRGTPLPAKMDPRRTP